MSDDGNVHRTPIRKRISCWKKHSIAKGLRNGTLLKKWSAHSFQILQQCTNAHNPANRTTKVTRQYATCPALPTPNRIRLSIKSFTDLRQHGRVQKTAAAGHAGGRGQRQRFAEPTFSLELLRKGEGVTCTQHRVSHMIKKRQVGHAIEQLDQAGQCVVHCC